ncbi:MAG: hypothetical protein MJE12_25510, partial [Alphaproteobacteria bacterium]|nr:hypothetical protein [Alphaproteobacteria bacterium]
SRLAAVIVFAIASFCLPATAATLDLTPIGETWLTTSPLSTTFDGRGIYIRADEDVTVDSIGWFGNLSQSGSYEIAIFSGQGEFAALGALQTVGATNFVAGGGSPVWNDIALGFTFESGMEYYVNFRRTDGGSNFSDSFHFINWGNLISQDSDIGLFALLDGRHGFAPVLNNNAWFTHFRMNVIEGPSPVPLPAALPLFLTVLAGMGFLRWWKRRVA